MSFTDWPIDTLCDTPTLTDSLFIHSFIHSRHSSILHVLHQLTDWHTVTYRHSLIHSSFTYSFIHSSFIHVQSFIHSSCPSPTDRLTHCDTPRLTDSLIIHSFIHVQSFVHSSCPSPTDRLTHCDTPTLTDSLICILSTVTCSIFPQTSTFSVCTHPL